MGYNSTMIILNDSLGVIEKDNKFGKKVSDAIKRLSFSNKRGIDISCSGHVNAATVIETHHSSQTVVVGVGGNCATVLGRHYDFRKETDEEKLAVLRSLADQLGYRLVKKGKN
jgi:coenzyme F420-reducing hydrogenase delta subunit